VFWRSYGFVTTLGWVINDTIKHFWLNYPFKLRPKIRTCLYYAPCRTNTLKHFGKKRVSPDLYRPQQVLVTDEESNDVGRPLRLTLLWTVHCEFTGNGFVQEEVWSHDGGHGPQVHTVTPLAQDHLTEELQQRLETHAFTFKTLAVVNLTLD